MRVAKRHLVYSVVWLLVVFLLTANVTYYLYNPRVQASFQGKVHQLESEYQANLEKRQSQLAFLQSVHSVEEPPTVEQQQIIDFINSGFGYASVENEAATDCSEFARPWRRFTNSQNCAFVLKYAVGDLKLLIVEFISPDFDLNDPNNREFIETLNSDQDWVMIAGREQMSFAYLKTFFEHEAEKFGVKGFSLTVDHTEPMLLSDFPPYYGKTREEQLAETGKSRTFFLNELADAQVDVRDYDAIAIAVFTTWSEQPFISFAMSNLRANVNRIVGGSGYFYTDDDVSLVAHETAHLFGATDQYIEGSFGCQEGTYDDYVTGDHCSLMCSLCVLDIDSPTSAVINKRAAREMGWIDNE